MVDHHKHCPKCETPWEEKETITEYFTNLFEKEGIPDYAKKDDRGARFKGVVPVKKAATNVAQSYGCTPETPKHFGKDVVGVEMDRDRVEYWECQKCKVHIDRFTGLATDKFKKKKETVH